MPTISQLPSANPLSAADQLPVSQGGTARATSVGALLASAQPAIIISSPSLVGRISLGSGGPEQVDVGPGISFSGGTLVADGLDHAAFPVISNLPITSDIVLSNQGSPMLMQASLLRGLFSAGQNVSIDPNGVIATTTSAVVGGDVGPAASIAKLNLVAGLAAQDLIAVNQAGSNCAISYSAFLDGITIDQAPPAAPASDTDVVWAAQDSNVMASQTFGAIWLWIANKLSSYKAPNLEVTKNINLDFADHNSRTLICSQPVTIAAITGNMGSGFQCTVINASTGNVTLGSAFISSTNSLTLSPLQSATLYCLSYSGGTIAVAAMPGAAPTSTAAVIPGQVGGLVASAATSTSVMVSWQVPTTGGTVSSYIVQSRPTGTTSWSGSTPITGSTGFQITALQPATSYDIVVVAQNLAGVGSASAILTVMTSSAAQTATPPPQVSGLTVVATSSNSVQLSWSAQTGSSAATGFTVQYRITGSSSWTSAATGVAGTGNTVASLQTSTSYDFSVFGVNMAGTGLTSATVTTTTLVATQPASAITWNLTPSGSYTRASGSIGVNAHVSPASSPIQFGFSLSATTPPSSWTGAVQVNTDLWGAYVPTPATTGTWYTWAEGLDGSAATAGPGSFTVQ